MEKLLKSGSDTKKPGSGKRLPAWAGWLIGWGAVLLFAAGLTYYWRVAFTLTGLPAVPFTLGVMGLFSLLYAALFLICRLKGNALCLQAALCVFLLGLLFCFATAPLQVPDETKYFLRANSISRGQFAYNITEDYPEEVDLLVEKFFPVGENPMNHRVKYEGAELAPAAFADYFDATQSGGEAEKQVDAPLLFVMLPFLPQGLFMAVARLFGFGALGQLYAGRLCNLLIYTVLCYFAFRNAARFRGLFIAFAMLPVSLFMAASCSSDSLMLALCFYALSVVVKSEVHLRDVILFGVALAVANYIKPLNFILALTLLMVPRKNWKLKVKPWVVLLAALVLVLGFYFLMEPIDRQISYAGGWGTAEELPRGSGDDADRGGQLAFVLANPLRFIAVAVQSVYEGDLFLFDLGHLGHMDMPLPVVNGLSLVLLILAAALAARPEPKETRAGEALLWGGVGLLYAAAVLAGMYITDTDLGSIRVTGQQPRYFLPALLLLFMLLAVGLGRLLRPRKQALGLNPEDPVLPAERATLWLAAGVGLIAVVLVFQNTFIGQWIPKAEGGWKLVNLFGWQVV